LNRAFKDRDHEKVTHPTGGLIFAMVVNFLMSTVVNILVDIHTRMLISCERIHQQWWDTQRMMCPTV
ncbi:hypothetical protein M4D58_26775, partial [Brevibacillus borstelensis]|uniref:hypothetical protein n=1 Tax=Brevibacillus borstelensis TaxID=45462 RepID=UPI0020413E0D